MIPSLARGQYPTEHSDPRPGTGPTNIIRQVRKAGGQLIHRKSVGDTTVDVKGQLVHLPHPNQGGNRYKAAISCCKVRSAPEIRKQDSIGVTSQFGNDIKDVLGYILQPGSFGYGIDLKQRLVQRRDVRRSNAASLVYRPKLQRGGGRHWPAAIKSQVRDNLAQFARRHTVIECARTVKTQITGAVHRNQRGTGYKTFVPHGKAGPIPHLTKQ